MQNVVLIGVGGIGFRHFQAILNYKTPIKLFVIDLNDDALKKCREEQENGKSNVIVFYSNTLEELPAIIDTLIIATSSIPRYNIFKEVVSKAKVHSIIFEKFLFPRQDEYNKASEILTTKKINAYVNCPGRMFPGYRELKNEIVKSEGGIAYISGSNWGLSCNAIHFIDQIGYLFDSYEKLYVDSTLLDKRIIDSKRKGYVEFTGRLTVFLGEKIQIIMDSFSSGEVPLRITLVNGGNVYAISEGERWIVEGKDGQFEKKDFETMYQSQLTDKVLDQLLNDKQCDLTTFTDTMQWHQALLEAFMNEYKSEGNDNSICPIT